MKVFPIEKKRYYSFTKHRIRRTAPIPFDWMQQLVPFSTERTNADSCVIANGIPKSGTHLLYAIVNYLNKWEEIGVCVKRNQWESELSREDVDQHACAAESSINKLRNGQTVHAHLGWSQELENVIERVTKARRVKHLMTYRDPRDCIVSQLNWVTYSEHYPRSSSTKAHRRFMLQNFANDDDRLTYFIQQGGGYITGFLEFAPWLRSSNCMTVKFEDLYTDSAALKEAGLGDVLKQVLTFLEIEEEPIDLLDFYKNVFGTSLTVSSEEQKVGQYKRVFKDQHHSLFDNPEFKDLLEEFGYEW
jgi:hypothetical protein